MITKKHFLVLKVLSDNCIKDDSCLINGETICAFVCNYKLVNENNVYEILNDLYRFEYIDLIKTFKRNEPIFCITLLKKGKNYKEERRKFLVDLRNKIIFAVIGGTISFIVGRFLLAIFK